MSFTTGGDTNLIHFSFLESVNSTINSHTLQATIIPSSIKTSGRDSAWIAIYHLYHNVTPLYDTVRVYAVY